MSAPKNLRLEFLQQHCNHLKPGLKNAPREYVDKVLAAFNLEKDSLDPEFPIRFAFAGAKHLILAVKERQTLADMSYQFDVVKSLDG